ncbi:unnamed protein product, partial [Ixodes hexagonus]
SAAQRLQREDEQQRRETITLEESFVDPHLANLALTTNQAGALEGQRPLDKLDDVLRHAQLRQYGHQVIVLDAIIRFLDVNPGRKQLVVVPLVEHFVEEGLLFGTLAASSST